MHRTPMMVYQLRISLEEIEPLIWRRVLFRTSTTLHELHRAIQLLFNWYDYHLYQFDINGRRFEAPDAEAEGEDATKVKLSQLGLKPGAEFRYTYDFGDHWVHSVRLEDLVPVPGDDPWIPWVVEGDRSGPPEDCGGPQRYSELQELLKQPLEDLEGDDRDLAEWVDEDFDPEEFSLMQARHALILSGMWGILKRRR
jgi:hypothetical protein